jgi:hypothetical protein
MVRSSCMCASHAFLLCMCVYLARVAFPASCLFSLFCALFSKIILFPKMACAQQAPNTDIVTRPESLPNSNICHCLCQCFIHFSYSLALLLSLTAPFAISSTTCVVTGFVVSLPLPSLYALGSLCCVDLDDQLFCLFL